MSKTALVVLALTLPMHAQMTMPMPSAQKPSAANKPAPARNAKAPAQPTAGPAQPLRDTPHPAVPFGQVADGDTSQDRRAVPDAPSPVAFGPHLQEQEHPAVHTGSVNPQRPGLLRDVTTTPAEPLDFFIALATAKNPTLQQASAQERRLRAEARQAGLWQDPEIGYEADHVRGGSYAAGEQGGYVQLTVPLAGQRSAARSAVAAQAAAAESALQAQQQRVRAGVEQAFYAALATQQEVKLRGDLASLAEDAATAAHQFSNIGQADAPDVLASEVDRERAYMELATAQRAYRKAFANLAAVSGDATLPISALLGSLTDVPSLPEAAVAQAAQQSPALALAEQQAAASDSAIRSARRDALPQLTLKGGLQQDNEPLGVGTGRVGVVGIAQAGLTLPLWNRNSGAVEAARARKAAANAAVTRTRLSLAAQAATALQDYNNAVDQAGRYRDELLPRAERALALYQGKYAAMAAAYPQRMLAQKTVFELQLEYNRALATAWQNAILLQHGLLTGGLDAPDEVGEGR